MIQATTADAYKLFHQGTICFSQIEQNGFRVDVDYINFAIKEVSANIRTLSNELKTDPVYEIWRKRFGQKMTLGSSQQLAEVIFTIMGYPSAGETETGKLKADESAFSFVDLPFIKSYFRIKKLEKILSTYLKDYQREQVNGYIHCFFNLTSGGGEEDKGGAKSGRSCIAKGTLIEVVRDVYKHPKGIPIEKVKVGDLVYCYDDNLKLTIRKVLWAGKTGTKKVIRVYWTAKGKKEYLDLTPEHKIRLVNGEYIRADQLEGRDFRTEEQRSRKHGKIRALAMARIEDRVWVTGQKLDFLDHRFVYETLIGPLKQEDVVHHKDHNHLNNIPSNLKKMSREYHFRYHQPDTLIEEARQKGTKIAVEMHRKGEIEYKYGEDNPNWLNISKFGFLRMLCQASGRPTYMPHDFNTMRGKAEHLEIDIKRVARRFDRDGKYISKGRLTRLAMEGREIARQSLGVNFYKLKELYQERGLSLQRKWGNQCGPFIPNNHKITKIENINKIVDVYDLEVEEFHNFIANEICVHNSCSNPNLQNIPVRNKEIAQYARRCFIPRDDHHLVEIDFSGIEVRIGISLHKDPMMIKYVTDPNSDMHRDMAEQIYKLDRSEITKDIRYVAKNQFVFPEFYGSYYIQCAKHLWDSIDLLKLKTVSGIPLKKHLRKKGIKELGKLDPKEKPIKGTFEHHLKEVEQDFWGNRFKIYAQWKKDYYNEYLEKGYFDYPTGFRVKGIYNRKEVSNFGTQGCLAGSSKVLTSNGLIPIRELVGKSTQIWTGFKWADAVGLDRGKCQRATIKLDSGLIIRCDTRHKLKNEMDEWIDFKDLKIGDGVALPNIGEPLQPSKEVNWWFVFGFMMGDGCFRCTIKNPNNIRKSLTIHGGKTKYKDLQSIREFLIEQGYGESGYRSVRWIVTPENESREEKYTVGIENKLFSAFLESQGFDYNWKYDTKRIPKSVWTATKQQQRDFMEGLWKSDGCRGKTQEKNLHMGNRELLKEVQILISGLGYDSQLTRTNDGHLLRVRWKHPRSVSHRKYPVTAIRRFVKGINWKNYDIPNEAIVDRKNFASGKDVNQYTAERMIQKNSSEALIYRYDKIQSIKILDREEITYTMSVDDSLHQFVADGVIHKNSAFHCLLWSVIQTQKWLTKKRMRSKLVCQVHDSMIGDVHKDELQTYIEKVVSITTKHLPKIWDWIIVPLAVEVEVGKENWWEKEPWEKVNGIWGPKSKEK